MTQYYSDPSREKETYALPDVEVFWADDLTDEEGEALTEGYYYWYCFPGCLPDSEPMGPYASEEEAVEAMREDAGQ